ncbi:MAG TPA: hypothetical protein VGB71_05460, partial [Flavisolibacter sp.]
ESPFSANPTFEYTFSETPEGIKVTQDFRLQSGMKNALFMWLFGAKSMMEETNQQGLELLKKSAESKE